MSQIIQADIIGQVGISGTTFSLAPSVLTLGGQQYPTSSTLTLTLSPVSASTKYNIFAIQTSGVVSLVFTTLPSPAGQTAYKLIYTFSTDASSNISNNTQWQTGKSYFDGDLVLVNDYLVKCVINHTAGIYATDVQSGYWIMVGSWKNYVINGAFDVWQRGTNFTGASVGSNAYGFADRWKTVFADATCTFSRTTGVNAGSIYGLKVQRNNASTYVGSVGTQNVLEGIDCKTLVGKQVTLSVKMKCGANFSGAYVICSFSCNTGVSSDEGAYSPWSNAIDTNVNLYLTTSFQTYVITKTVPSNAFRPHPS